MFVVYERVEKPVDMPIRLRNLLIDSIENANRARSFQRDHAVGGFLTRNVT